MNHRCFYVHVVIVDNGGVYISLLLLPIHNNCVKVGVKKGGGDENDTVISWHHHCIRLPY
jgi:hypothetical protein